MEPLQPFQVTTSIRDEDPKLPSFDAPLENNPTPPHHVVPQTQRSTRSTPTPPPVNPTPQSQLNIDLQERPHTLTTSPNPHNPQPIVYTNSTATTQPIPNTIYSHQPTFSTPTPLDATRTPQSIHALPVNGQSARFNSTATKIFQTSIRQSSKSF